MRLAKGETRRDALRMLGLGALGAWGAGCPIPRSAPEVYEKNRDEVRRLERALDELAQKVLNVEEDVAAFLHLKSSRLFVCAGQNHFWQRRHAPGSIIKIVTAYALLESGWEDRAFLCTGAHLDPYGIRRNCWLHAGHGPMQLRTALAHSCNVWFLEQLQSLSAERWLDAMRSFGFGGNLVTSTAAPMHDLIPPHLTAAELYDAALGVSDLHQTNAASLLRMITLVASAGRMAPFGSVAGTERSWVASPIQRLWLDPVIEGLQEAVRAGTLKEIFPEADVIAKTGTAPKNGYTSTRGLIVGYFPVQNPAFSFVVIKNTGRGAADAGPPANALLRAVRREGALL